MESDIDAWIAGCGSRTFEPGERIIDSDSTPPEQVLVVREGAVRLFVDGDTRRSETVDLVGRGQMLGVSAAFGSSPLALNADALTRVVACVSEGRSFLFSLATSPDIVLNLVRQAGVRIMQFGGDAPRPQQQLTEVRLAEVLQRLALAAGEPAGTGRRIPLCVSRGTLAYQVGCARETIARMLASLEMAGAVTRQGRAIVVDTDRLAVIIRSGSGIAVVEKSIDKRM